MGRPIAKKQTPSLKRDASATDDNNRPVLKHGPRSLT